MCVSIGHLPNSEKVSAGKVAVCLPFCAVMLPFDASRAHQGHNLAQYHHPAGASHRLAVSPHQARGSAFALAGIMRRVRENACPEPSLSPQRHHGIARRHSVGFSCVNRPGWVPAAPVFLIVMDQAGSASAPRRKIENPFTIHGGRL